MTNLDEASRFRIEWACTRLVHSYANLNDAHDWAAVASLYVEEATMVRPSAPDQPIHGRDAILAALLARPARITRHVSANVVIYPQSEQLACGESAMLLFVGDSAPLVGSFQDRFVRTAEGWRFASRVGALDRPA